MGFCGFDFFGEILLPLVRVSYRYKMLSLISANKFYLWSDGSHRQDCDVL